MDEVEFAAVDSLTRALDLHSLRILVAIDRTGSISAAARMLGYTQPTITQHVQRLESRLGASLVARTARSARLTPVGALLAEHAPRIDASLTAAASDLARMLGRRAGAVRIVADAEAIASTVAPALRTLAASTPGVEVSLIEAEDAAALDMVRDGRADIAVTTRLASPVPSIAKARRDGLRTTFLFSEEVLAILGPSDVEPSPRIAPGSLADLPWIRGAGTCADAVAARIGRDANRADLAVSRADAAIALVMSGFGATFVAESAFAAVPQPGGVRAAGLSPAMSRSTIATTLVEAAGIPAVAAALRALTAHRPPTTGVDAVDEARRRSHGHRARFVLTPGSTIRYTPSTEEASPMSSTTLTRTARASAAAAGVLLLAACAAGAPDTSVGADTGEEIAEITVALPGSLSSLYIGQEAGILNYYIASIAQEGLVSIDAEGKIQPGLAESWEQTDDVTYVYELRDDAKFQDGTPVTADDVVFSLEQARDETASPGLAYYLGGVDTIEKTGEHEVTVTLTAPDAAFAANMSTGGAAFITSQAFWEEHDGKIGTASSLLLGSGPYQVTEFVPDSHVTLERVDTWWGETPKVKSIQVEFIPDESTRLLAAQSGDVDVAFNVPLAQSTQWEQLDTMRVEYVNDLSYVGLYFNTGLAPFDDPKVREAFAHSIDREAVVEKLLRGHGEAATAMMTPESLGKAYSAEEARERLSGIPQWGFDLDAAKAALAASDHPDGFETEILTPSTGPQLGSAAQSLAENLSKIGITLNVREVPIEEWLASLDASSSYGVGLMWYFSTLGDPAEVPSYLLGAGNPAAYSNPEIDDLIAQAGAESDPAARIDLLIQAETLQAEDAVNVPLWWGQSATAFAKDLGIRDYSSFAFISAWPTQLYRAEQ
ncbi:ABC transporter substrate-binding protein [Agromyces sp. Leaf222]|uniref:ABC transporter substrate-binding protein n=1 Tax=Agromyces sp. Leaf222 TaxID=1735688 RepID=UPI0006F9F7B0|nr:ABC transporter substrate-binding protein [Agromyces sp. Leaf222]KQM81482.1 ABC transporter substrate-binding protein [Agromyces sp. Leaf222]